MENPLRSEAAAFRLLMYVVAACAAIALVAVLTGCGVKDDPDLVAGKKAFVAKCASCHTLARAESKGQVGPNLDEAFQQSLRDGFGRDGIEGVVASWITDPSIFYDEKRYDTGSTKAEPPMPADLVTGDTVRDVAAYVASVVAAGGQDSGLLAEAVRPATSDEPIAAEGGTLVMPATGPLNFASNKATAEAGQLSVEMPNRSEVVHNIVIDEIGKGEVVPKGGTSTISGSLDAGEFAFYCSVPGHREGGMEGKLTVK